MKILSPLILMILLFGSCKKMNPDHNRVIETSGTPNFLEMDVTEPHPYGGWYCPDNIFGFPPVNSSDVDKIDIVANRLPTLEETRSGLSLIHIDATKYKDAKPYDMSLPRMARYYTHSTQKDELVIIIQSVIVDQDTIVGFRYLNGGNGSARLHEVTLLDAEETKKMDQLNFVYESVTINASNSLVWKVMTDSTYAKELGTAFGENAYVKSDWAPKGDVEFYYNDKVVSTGNLTAVWPGTYIQIDYDFDGFHYAEKYLISRNEEDQSVKLQLACGPYTQGYEDQINVWKLWLNKVKFKAEALQALKL